MSRKAVLILAALIILVIAAVAASPLLALHSLRSAARSGDVAQLDRTVDFPAVREDLKRQLQGQLATRVQSDRELTSNPLADCSTRISMNTFASAR